MAWGLTAALVLAAIGFGVGAFGTLVGAGGGFILTPILLLLYPHDSPRTITAISIAVVFFNASSGSIAYAKQRRTDFRSGLIFATATLPGAVLGALAIGYVSRHVFDALTGVVLILLAVWLFEGSRARGEAHTERGTLRQITDRDGVEHTYRVPVARGTVLSLFVGFASSFLGIGGGIIHVPLLVQTLGFPVHIATATSHFVLVVMSGAATLTHIAQGSYHPETASGALSPCQPASSSALNSAPESRFGSAGH